MVTFQIAFELGLKAIGQEVDLDLNFLDLDLDKGYNLDRTFKTGMSRSSLKL